jgi:FKBP-type peptidyl-prolyl cis-trans isomerase FkpA
MLLFIRYKWYFVSLPAFVTIILLCVACSEPPKPSNSTRHLGMMSDSLVNYNRGVVRTEDQQIDDFIDRYGWKMTKTGTGLRYLIFQKGYGAKAIKGKVAVIRYTLRFLNGTLCYSSDKDGLKEFKIGYGNVESGVEEGILLMHVGDRAKFIVPSHLAFGLLGDQNKIPQQATLVYDIELVKIK